MGITLSVGQCVIDIHSDNSYATTAFPMPFIVIGYNNSSIYQRRRQQQPQRSPFQPIPSKFLNTISNSSTVFTRKIIDEKMINCFVLVSISFLILKNYYFIGMHIYWSMDNNWVHKKKTKFFFITKGNDTMWRSHE